MDDPRIPFGDRADKASQYVDILASRGVDWGLIGPREVERLWPRHLVNSIAISSLVPEGARVIDVGSGAGLPGIPLAIARPDLRVTLLEPLLRRANFLGEAIEELGLDGQVTVVRGRAEEHRDTYDVVTARAVAALPKLVAWCVPLLNPRGELLAHKGQTAEQELIDAAALLRNKGLTGEALRLTPLPNSEPTWVVRIR